MVKKKERRGKGNLSIPGIAYMSVTTHFLKIPPTSKEGLLLFANDLFSFLFPPFFLFLFICGPLTQGVKAGAGISAGPPSAALCWRGRRRRRPLRHRELPPPRLRDREKLRPLPTHPPPIPPPQRNRGG